MNTNTVTSQFVIVHTGAEWVPICIFVALIAAFAIGGFLVGRKWK